MYNRNRGLTLIEICVVIVIIALMTEGFLKGQELIRAARIHDLIAQQDGVRAAFLGFQDRYKALPGDYKDASTTIPCVPDCTNGNGNGIIDAPESLLAWSHLAGAQFISGSYINSGNTPNEWNSPKNVYGAYLVLQYDNAYGDHAGPPSPHHNIKTGTLVPVEILEAVDKKIDDGKPYSGTFQFSSYTVEGTAPDANECVINGQWNILYGSSNCGGTTIINN